MKRFYASIAKCLIAVAAVALGSRAEAATSFYVGGVNYTVTSTKDATVSVARNSLSYYAGDLVIPATVENEGTVYSVTGIAQSAFYNCTELTSVTIGPNVKTIARGVFTGCAGLMSIKVDATNPTWSATDGVLFGNNGTKLFKFPAAKITDQYIIPEGVTDIEEFAFEYAFGISNVSFPSTLKNIGIYAFQYSPITEAVFPAGMESVGENAFYACPYLAKINTGGLTRIADYAFCDCPSVTELTFGDNVTYIGDGAFFQLKILPSVTLPETLQTLGSSSFKSCESLKTIYIPASVTSIGTQAFSFCKAMRSIKVAEDNATFCDLDGVLCNKAANTILEFPAGYPGEYEVPEGITAIGNRAFYYRTRLTEITLPQSLRVIGESAFHACSTLKEIVIPNGVTSLGDEAFMFCDGLKKVTIGAKVKTIGTLAFSMCDALRAIDCYAVNPPALASTNVFSLDTYNLAQLCVPQGSKEAYAGATGWSDFKKVDDILTVGIIDVKADAENAFTEVFNTSGVLLYSGPRHAMPQLPTGIYIERTGSVVRKVSL